MEAKDTVMSDGMLGYGFPYPRRTATTEDLAMQDWLQVRRAIAGKQAEISFKAGQESTKEGHEAISYLEGYQEGEKVGRKSILKGVSERLGVIDQRQKVLMEKFSDIEPALKESKKAGRKEVVDWLYQENAGRPLYNDGSYIIVKMRPESWQAKLNEWGIEPVKETWLTA